MVVHETQRFILVRDVMHAKPYSSGVAGLVFIYSITGVVAPSYDVVWCGGGLKMSPRSRAQGPYPLYIGRGVELQRGRLGQYIVFLVCYDRLILSYRPDTPAMVRFSLHVGLTMLTPAGLSSIVVGPIA
jgi:hypothetical protein